MHYFYEQLSKTSRMGVYTDTNPYVAEYAITPNEISFTGGYVDVSAVSAGINAGNPATILLEYSKDGGTKWYGVTGLTADPIDAVGQFGVEVGGQVFVGPLMRITVTPPAGESITITEVGIRRIRPGMVATLLSYGVGGGGLGDVGIFYLRGPGGVYANTKPTYDLTTPASNRPIPVSLVPDAGNPSSAVSSAAGVLTAPNPAYGFMGFSAMTAWDANAATRSEVSGSDFEKAAPADSRAMDCMSWAVNTTVGAWVQPQADTLGFAARYTQAADNMAAAGVVAAIGLWDGADRTEILAENVAAAVKHVLTEAPTRTLPVTGVVLGWDGAATEHRELEVTALAAAQYAVATPQVLNTMPLMGWDEDNTTHKEAQVDANGNLHARNTWIRNGVEQEVVENSATPSANMPLPVQPMAANSVAGGFQPLQETEGGYLKVQETAPVAGTFYNSYVVTPVTTGAWVEISAGIGNDMKAIEIFDSSGRLLELGIGGIGVEARKILIFPGGNGRIPCDIPTGTRLTLRAIDANATVGFFAVNWYRG
jgi:hypothetical protein